MDEGRKDSGGWKPSSSKRTGEACNRAQDREVFQPNKQRGAEDMSVLIWSLTQIGLRPKPMERPRLGRGVVYSPKSFYHRQLENDARMARPAEPISQPVELFVRFTFAWPKSTPKKKRIDGWRSSKPDLDNIVKGCGDFLERAGVVMNDSIFVKIVAEKRVGEHDSTQIEIRRLDP